MTQSVRVTPVNEWLKKVEDFANAAKNSTEPITFVLGAGCSISSGAPTTTAVHQAFEHATTGRANGQPLRNFLQEIKESERQRILTPLFEGQKPYLGYRSLAALARLRRVHVLNLNWDVLVEDGCKHAGVDFVSFDLSDTARWRDLGSLPPGRGLACVHVHGILGSSCRYSVLETLTFKPAEVKFIRKNFWNHLLLVVGASLQGDLDLEAFLTGDSDAVRKNGLWYFGRGWGDDDDARIATQDRLHLLGANPREVCIDRALDFDRLMLVILEVAKQIRWDDLVSHSHSTLLPQESELTLVEPRLISKVLDSPALALIGEPRLGKTVLAHFLAHCLRLWAPHQTNFRRFDSPETAVAALAGVNTSTADPGILIVEDPFGPTDRFEENPEFFSEAIKLFPNGKPLNPLRLIVTSRRHGWHTALERQSSASASFAQLSERPSEWYRQDDLIRLADGNERLKGLIEQGQLRSPGMIALLKRNQKVYGSEALDGDTIKETVALFEKFPQTGILCSLVRLQDFCQTLFPEDELYRLADAPKATVTDAFLQRFKFESFPHLKLDHPSTREAVDAYLERHWVDLADHLKRKLYPDHQLIRAIEAWKLLVLSSDGRDSDADSAVLNRWGAAYFAANPTLLRLREVMDRTPDMWAMTELAYEIVRLWEALPRGKDRLELLGEFASDRGRFGTYALFEACLYLQGAARPEIRAIVESEAWKLISDPSSVCEAALMVDGWMWRPLPNGEMPAWITTFFQNLQTTDPAWSLVRFLEGYHPEGFARLPSEFRERDRSVVWTREQANFATWLVKWHFAHQAYSRVLLSRLRLMDKDFLCRSLHPILGAASFGAIQRLVDSLANFPDFSGWAFHLGLNVGCVQARLDPSFTERVRELAANVLPADEGLVTAAVTYSTAKLFQNQLRRYFADSVNREKLFDVLRDGVRLDGAFIKPPRFSFSREPAILYDEFDLRWTALRAQKVNPQATSSLSQELWMLAQSAIRSGRITSSEIDAISAEVEAGDLRRLEKYASAARAGVSPMQQILDTYLSAKEAMPLFVD